MIVEVFKGSSPYFIGERIFVMEERIDSSTKARVELTQEK
jgi:hypothetical protein